VNVPAGGVLWPLSFTPQQTIEPPPLTAQVYEGPALIWVNVPDGGVLSP
jgi:hypothetical protein